jgi:hypothetical protein
MNLNELHCEKSEKRAKKAVKNSQKPPFLTSFWQFLAKKRHFSSKEILGFHSLTFLPFRCSSVP